MIEVSPRLWVGSGRDVDSLCETMIGSALLPHGPWFILTCAKEPWHREALGYTSAGAPKDHPEYLFARRGNRLILNMVDADNPDYFSAEMVNEGLHFIGDALKAGGKVLVHCNQGESRGPGMALLYLLTVSDALGSALPGALPGIEYACEMFKRRYPPFNPKRGILGVIERRIFGGAPQKSEQPQSDDSDGWLMRIQ